MDIAHLALLRLYIQGLKPHIKPFKPFHGKSMFIFSNIPECCWQRPVLNEPDCSSDHKHLWYCEQKETLNNKTTAVPSSNISTTGYG